MDNYFSSPKDKAADLRLRRIFGISLFDYNIILAAQHGVCKICGNPPRKVRLAVDHDHKFDRIKIITSIIKKTTLVFKASAKAIAPNGQLICFFSDTRKKARVAVHLALRRMSIRGLLCMNCNRGLQKFYDKPERFEAAASYLREFERRIKNEKVSINSGGDDSSISARIKPNR